MPKGHLIPLPVLCSLTIGEPIQVEENETRQEFLERARATLISLGKGE